MCRLSVDIVAQPFETNPTFQSATNERDGRPHVRAQFLRENPSRLPCRPYGLDRLGCLFGLGLVGVSEVTSGCAQSARRRSRMSSDNQSVVKRWWEELWNQGNLAVADQIVAPNFTDHDPASPWVPTGHRRMQNARDGLSHGVSGHSLRDRAGGGRGRQGGVALALPRDAPRRTDGHPGHRQDHRRRGHQHPAPGPRQDHSPDHYLGCIRNDAATRCFAGKSARHHEKSRRVMSITGIRDTLGTLSLRSANTIASTKEFIDDPRPTAMPAL